MNASGRNHRSMHRRGRSTSNSRATSMPKIYDALTLDENRADARSASSRLGDGVVRTIALGSSDGLRRGMKVVNTGAPIMVPGRSEDARPDHGRARPADRRARARSAPKGRCRSIATRRRSTSSRRRTELLETGIKVIDLVCPFAKGGKGRPVRRRRRRQDRDHDGAHPQHRDRALGLVGVRRRRRAHARGQRLLSRDDGRGRRQQGDLRSRRWRWSTAR